jgi:HlyD family secretion protein
MKLNKKIVVIAIFVLVAAVVVYLCLKPKEPAYKTAKVTRGPITQEISETGTIKKGDPINLNFKNSGTIARINVVTGQNVSAGQVLAELDTSQLKVQLAQARANLDLYQSQLAKLMKGVSADDIILAQTSVQNSQSALQSAQQSLADAQESARQKLANYYDSAKDVLSAAYAKAYNAQNFAGLLQRTYFTPRDNDSITVWEDTQKIGVAVVQIKNYINTYQASGKDADIDKAVAGTQIQLGLIAGWLRNIRVICEQEPWRDAVSETNKNSLDTQRDYVIAAQTSVNSAGQSIALQKATNETAINTAQAAVTTAQGTLKTAQDQLTKITNPPRAEDVDALNAQIAGAAAQVSLLELQISDSQLKAPANGQVIAVNARVGETSQPLLATSGTIVVLPDNPYKIEVDIYEEDVTKEKIGDAVTISPVATPDVKYPGKVVSIDPSSKLVNGVVYYTTTIGFDQVPEDIKPGMSADIVIITASNENALLIPEGALQKNDTGNFVQILKSGKPQNVAVQAGIKAKGQVEIISGLNEGEEVIIP